MAAQASAAWRDAQLAGLSLLIGESVGYAPRGAKTAAARSVTHPTDQCACKKPGAVSRPGTLREFEFPEYYDLNVRVNGFIGELYT
jgi:hypothetical protein